MATAMLMLAALGAVVAWLLPNHYPPWLSFHAEAAMAASLCIALVGVFSMPGNGRIRLYPFTLVLFCLAAWPMVQFLAGTIYFVGDALLACAYLLMFAMAQLLGQRLTERFGAEVVFERLSALAVIASLCCVGLQLYQWLGISGLGIYAAELPPGGRPFANFAQPNHLATLLYLGLVGILFLYERGRVGAFGTSMAALFLMLGLTMTSARTAWVEVVVLILWLIASNRRSNLRLQRKHAVGLGLAFVSLLLVWKPLNDLMLLLPGRTLSDQVSSGPRLLLLESMADAVSRAPIAGYGWNQGLVAQSHVAMDHAAEGRLIESSHNLPMDLLVWNGIPLGMALIGFLAWWVFSRARDAGRPVQAYAFAAVAGVLVHALVEYPLSYAYFLVPVGVVIGCLDASGSAATPVSLRRSTVLGMTVLFAGLLSAIAFEYAQVEDNIRRLRFETARIGTSTIEKDVPDLLVLTQWEAFIRAMRNEPLPGMPTDEIERWRKVSERFPFASMQMQYALALGLNSQPQAAARVLGSLCQIHTKQVCFRSLQQWRSMTQNQHPVLSAVEVPARR